MSHVRFPATGFEVSFNLASQANVGRSKCDGWRGWSRVIVVILIFFGTFAPNLSTQMTPGPKCPADLLQRPTPLMWDAFPAPALFYKESGGSQLCEEHKLSKDCLKVMLQDGDVFWQSRWVSATNITRNCPSHSDQFQQSRDETILVTELTGSLARDMSNTWECNAVWKCGNAMHEGNAHRICLYSSALWQPESRAIA